MSAGKTPAVQAAALIVDEVARDYGMTTAAAARLTDTMTAIIAQATLDACEQAAPRVRAEGRRQAFAEVAAECERRAEHLAMADPVAAVRSLAAWARQKAGE